MTENIMTENIMTENIMTVKRMTEKPLLELSLTHKEFHVIMNRPQFKCDLTGQDASDYDDFIDAKIHEHNNKLLQPQLIALKKM